MKKQRQQEILHLISINEIETQDELMEMLNRDGYKVTQATISRDIRELKISKVLGVGGKYHYAVSGATESVHKNGFKNAYTSSILSIESAGNMVVVKTHPGLAQAVAAGIDAMHIRGVLGCVAGDDTIIIVATDTAVASESIYKLKDNS